MKELIKPNQQESSYNEVDAYCETQCARCPNVTCFCEDSSNSSTTEEDDILF